MVVPSAINTKNREGNEEDSTLFSETSPLTIATDESKSTTTTNSSKCWKRKSTRGSPLQASIARLHAKIKLDSERQQYSTAFKEATFHLCLPFECPLR